MKDDMEPPRGGIVRMRRFSDFSVSMRTVLRRKEGMKFGHDVELGQKPRRRLPREVTAIVYQVHLIEVVLIAGDAGPPAVGKAKLVVQGGVEPDDSSVKLRRDADLLEEASFELPE